MPPLRNLAGEKFGRLTVVGRDILSLSRRIKWVCRCECGNIKSLYGTNLVGGLTRSCGCYCSEVSAKRMSKMAVGQTHTKTHGYSKDPTYLSWVSLKMRCDKETRGNYKYYGGKGITYCDKWKTFEGFLEDMGTRPEGTTIDRIDSNKNYCPENCRWATKQEQVNNRKKIITAMFQGQEYPLTELSKMLGLEYQLLWQRRQRGANVWEGRVKGRRTSISTSSHNQPLKLTLQP
jgi:hypothetical protein